MDNPLGPRDPADIDLQKTQPPAASVPASTGGPSYIPWIAAAVLVVAGVAVYLLFLRDAAPDTPVVATAPTVEPAAAEPERPLGADVEPLDLPPLGQSDEIVRSLVRGLSAHPRVAAWLTTDQLVRNFTVSVDNIANGVSPARHLRVLRPTDPFAVTQREHETIVNPESYARYTSIAAAVESIDPHGAARLYAMLKPRIDEAARELGITEPFDRTLERAVLVLLNTPAPDGGVRVVPQGGVFQYEDPALEGLTGAQKQFARMGPRNVRVIQGRLQEIALALGIPAERLAP